MPTKPPRVVLRLYGDEAYATFLDALAKRLGLPSRSEAAELAFARLAQASSLTPPPRGIGPRGGDRPGAGRPRKVVEP